MSKMGQELDRKLDENKYEMYEALQKIAKAEGAYSLDRLKHAENTIENMQKTAQKALAKIGGG